MSKYDLEAVRQSAAGRWASVLSSAGGIDAAALDGQHHPCPKCGGTDRFRLVDESAGAVLCNQCFSKRNGDGFAAVQWAQDCTFGQAVEKVATYLGISPNKRAKADPAKDLVWTEWSSQLVKLYLQGKPGVTEAAILAAGGRMATYKRNYTVIAFPIVGPTLDTERPVGWMLVNAAGGDLPKWDKNGSIIGRVDKKVTYGSEPGLVGIHAIERLKAVGLVDVCWKTEGLTDLLAVMAAIPPDKTDRHVVVTNSNGSKQNLGWMAGVLARVPTNVIHDCDEPGQVGGQKAAKEIAAQGGKPRFVVLPYPIAEKHGKDVRDWLVEGNTHSDLAALADRSESVEIKTTADGERDYSGESWPVQEQILRKLQIEVLYETEDGRVRIFSWLLRKSSWIASQSVERIKKEKMVQICGPPAMVHISSDPDENSWDMQSVREAIALMASSRREKHNERGVGVWQGQDENEAETDAVVLVNDTEASRWQHGRLERIVTPRSDGLVMDFGAGYRDWYDHDELGRYLAEAESADWCHGVLESLYGLLNKWRWGNQDTDPTLIAGLALATWVQTVWAWRPLVAIIGESHSGKSLLFEALGGTDGRRGIFGGLSFKQGKSTEAGIRQGIGNTARAVLCDEFEKSRERDKILEMLRASTRGEMIGRGTSDQRGMVFQMRHIGWVAAIEAGLQRQPDVNRFIQVELKKADVSKQGKLLLPNDDTLHRLGQKLLAVAVRYAVEAKQLALDLKGASMPGIDARTIEVYAVPAAILACAVHYSRPEAEGLLRDLLGSVEAEEQGRKDHDDLLGDILGSLVNCGGKDGMLTVGQIIEDLTIGARYAEHRYRMEAAGVAAYEEDGKRLLFVAHRQVASKLIRGSNWEGQRIDQILLRIPGSRRTKRLLGGVQARGILIELEDLPKDDEF